MNIEEERKAFEAVFKPDEGVKWSEDQQWYYCEPAWEEGLRETVNYFTGWLAAKAHAAEMARQGCFLQYDAAGKWWIVIPGKMRQGTYATKEEAEQRAVREGLRIDTPKTEFLDVY